VGLLTPKEWKQDANDAEVTTFPWPDYVTAAEKNRIEESLRTIFDVGGREGREAEEYLVSLDRGAEASALRVSGRLVSEMKHVLDEYGLKGLEGKSRLMVLDRILRNFDGVQERLLGLEYGIDIDDPPSRVMRIVRGWMWWYADGRFRQRYEPWDWMVDGQDAVELEEEEGGD
jgi:hypothetical protein